MLSELSTRMGVGLLLAVGFVLLFLLPWLIEPETASWIQMAACFPLLLLASYEWLGARVGASNAVAAMSCMLILSVAVWEYPQLRVLLLSVGVLLWLGLVPLLLALFSRGGAVPIALLDWVLAIALMTFWSGVVSLALMPREEGAVWLFYALVLVALADVGGYFVGHLLGRLRISPTISPGKTLEGLIGGCVLAMLAPGGLWLAVGAEGMPLGIGATALVVLSVALVIVSFQGDLFESLAKRTLGLKDISNFLPGHGGLLDRIDGHLPVMVLLASLLMH